jgi:hypothetical protein
MNNPVIGPPVAITNEGLRGTDGGGDVLHNFDVAYDPSRDRFYAVREVDPYPASEPSYIAAELEIDSIDGASIWNGGGTWTREGGITPDLTGFARNHNAGILRSIYGTLPSADSLTAVFTRSITGTFPETLWSYALWQVAGSLS